MPGRVSAPGPRPGRCGRPRNWQSGQSRDRTGTVRRKSAPCRRGGSGRRRSARHDARRSHRRGPREKPGRVACKWSSARLCRGPAFRIARARSARGGGAASPACQIRRDIGGWWHAASPGRAAGDAATSGKTGATDRGPRSPRRSARGEGDHRASAQLVSAKKR